MRAPDAYAHLRQLGLRVVRTDDAAARWRAGRPAASRMLERLADAGLVRRVAHGLWAVDVDIDPLALPPFLTAPHPAYVSLQSALYYHGIISQIPQVTYVVSLARTRLVHTELGTYSIHHLPPPLFGGHAEGPGGAHIARAPKALVDVVYLSNVKTRLFFALPELDLPDRFDIRETRRWIAVIPSASRRTMVEKRLAALFAQNGRSDLARALTR